MLFNLSQAYGRAFQVDDLNHTLALAQAVDSELVAELMALQGGESEGFVVDLPLPNRLMWSRVLESGRGGGIASRCTAERGPDSDRGHHQPYRSGRLQEVWPVRRRLSLRSDRLEEGRSRGGR